MSREAFLARYWSNVEIATPGHFSTSWRDPDFRAALGVSEEYYQNIIASQRDARGSISEHPGYREAWQEHREAQQAFHLAVGLPPHAGTPMINLQLLNEEQLTAFNRSQEAGQRLESITSDFLAAANRRSAEALDNALTPELKRQFQEVPLMEMVLGENPFFSPSAFAALNLTDAQGEQMEQIKHELEPEFERHLEIYVEGNGILFDRSIEAFHEAARAEREARLRGEDTQGISAIQRRILMEDTEYQRALDEVYSSARAFARLFTTRVFEILNNEQRRRLQGLINNPPLHVRLHIQRLRREQWGQHEEGERAGTAAGVGREIWVPGPDAWRPGDPIPVQLEERERSRFPQDE